MSGEIGGAGSRSGQIGNTEIDYEEGVWTPTFEGSTSTTGGGYSQQDGTYTKVGNLVMCQMATAFSSEPTMSGSYIYLRGLPFVTDAYNWYCPGNTFLFNGWGVNRIMFTLQMVTGVTQAYVLDIAAATTSLGTATSGEMDANTAMGTSFTYRTLGVRI